MDISASMVKELRDKTGAGFMQCKNALKETSGDMDQAADLLRKQGVKSAEKRSGRATAEGIVGSYVHAGGKIAVLVEVNCETDFVARTDDFKALVHDLCMHVAATAPRYVKREEVPAEAVDKEREIITAQVRESGKPENVVERIVSGKLDKFFQESCLVEQPFVKDTSVSIGDHLTSVIAKLGENIQIRRFVRYALGD